MVHSAAALKRSEEICNGLTDMINLAKEVSDIVATERKKIAATNINVIDAAARGNLRETGHSRVLYNLLKNQEVCEGFIKEFLPDEVVKSIEFDNIKTDDVGREKQYIDISIWIKPYFFIIENKVKDAVEQKGQIYRYVQYGLQEKTTIDKIYVLYLNKDTYDFPTYYSLNEEGKENGTRAFTEEMKVKHIIPLSYKDDIYKWINNIYESEKKKEEQYEILFSALVQYKDYLEDYFELSNKYKDMTNKINEYLANELSLNGEGETEQLKILYNQFKNVTTLANSLGNFMIPKLRNDFESKINDKGVRLIKKDDRIFDYPILGIEFSINGVEVQCAAEIEKEKGPKLFYGIRCHQKNQLGNIYKELEKVDLIEGFSSAEYYPIWKYCDIDTLVENTYNLAIKIIEIANDPNSGFKL